MLARSTINVERVRVVSVFGLNSRIFVETESQLETFCMYFCPSVCIFVDDGYKSPTNAYNCIAKTEKLFSERQTKKQINKNTDTTITIFLFYCDLKNVFLSVLKCIPILENFLVAICDTPSYLT